MLNLIIREIMYGEGRDPEMKIYLWSMLNKWKQKERTVDVIVQKAIDNIIKEWSAFELTHNLYSENDNVED